MSFRAERQGCWIVYFVYFEYDETPPSGSLSRKSSEGHGVETPESGSRPMWGYNPFMRALLLSCLLAASAFAQTEKLGALLIPTTSALLR